MGSGKKPDLETEAIEPGVEFTDRGVQFIPPHVLLEDKTVQETFQIAKKLVEKKSQAG